MHVFYKLGHYLNANYCYKSSYDTGIYALGYKKNKKPLAVCLWSFSLASDWKRNIFSINKPIYFSFSFIVTRESYRINHLQGFCPVKMVHRMKILENHGIGRSISHSWLKKKKVGIFPWRIQRKGICVTFSYVFSWAPHHSLLELEHTWTCLKKKNGKGTKPQIWL